MNEYVSRSQSYFIIAGQYSRIFNHVCSGKSKPEKRSFILKYMKPQEPSHLT
jgi:hypothetical protein